MSSIDRRHLLRIARLPLCLRCLFFESLAPAQAVTLSNLAPSLKKQTEDNVQDFAPSQKAAVSDGLRTLGTNNILLLLIFFVVPNVKSGTLR